MALMRILVNSLVEYDNSSWKSKLKALPHAASTATSTLSSSQHTDGSFHWL